MWHAHWKDWPAQISFSRNENRASPPRWVPLGNEVASFLLGAVDSSNIPSLANTSVNYQVTSHGRRLRTGRLQDHAANHHQLWAPLESLLCRCVSETTSTPPWTWASRISSGRQPAGDLCVPPGGTARENAYEQRVREEQRTGPESWVSRGNTVRSVWWFAQATESRTFPTGLYGAGNNAYLTDGFNPTSTSTTPDAGITPAFTFAQGFPAAQLQTKNLTSSYSNRQHI